MGLTIVAFRTVHAPIAAIDTRRGHSAMACAHTVFRLGE